MISIMEKNQSLSQKHSWGAWHCSLTCLRPNTSSMYSAVKRHTGLDDFIMLVKGHGSTFHVTAGSHPVHEHWGHESVCTWGLVMTIQKKVSTTFHF